jgi:hypothetical protein
MALFCCQSLLKTVVKTMDQGKGDEEDLAARYFEFAPQQFLTLSNEETDGMASTEAAAAASVLNIMGVAARAMIGEEDEEMPDAEETPVWGGSSPRKTPNKSRDFSGTHKKLVEQYFSGDRQAFTMKLTLTLSLEELSLSLSLLIS